MRFTYNCTYENLELEEESSSAEQAEGRLGKGKLMKLGLKRLHFLGKQLTALTEKGTKLHSSHTSSKLIELFAKKLLIKQSRLQLINQRWE